MSVRPGQTFQVWGDKNIDSFRKGSGKNAPRYGGKGGGLLATVKVPPKGLGRVEVYYSGSTVRGVAFFDPDGRELGRAQGTAMNRGYETAEYGGNDELIDSLTITHGRLVDSITAIAREHPRVELRRQKKEDQRKFDALQEEFDQFKKDQKEKDKELAKKNKEIKANQETIRKLVKDGERYKSEIAALKEENRQLREENRQLRQEISELRTELAAARNEIAALRTELARITQLLEQMMGL